MKRHIRSRGALQFIKAVLNRADEIGYTMTYEPEKQWEELRKKRAMVKGYIEALYDSDGLPCGYQDAIGDRLDAASWNLSVQIAAMQICKGKLNRSVNEAWMRAQIPEGINL